jgi:hypothetical protein
VAFFEIEAARVEAVVGDILDARSVSEALEGCDACVHAAAFATLNPELMPKALAVNGPGTRAVIDAAIAADCDPIVYESPVIGDLDGRTSPARGLSFSRFSARRSSHDEGVWRIHVRRYVNANFLQDRSENVGEPVERLFGLPHINDAKALFALTRHMHQETLDRPIRRRLHTALPTREPLDHLVILLLRESRALMNKHNRHTSAS